MSAHLTMHTYGINQGFWIVVDIWLHRKSRQIQKKNQKRPILHQTCATCSKLPSYISTMRWWDTVITIVSTSSFHFLHLFHRTPTPHDHNISIMIFERYLQVHIWVPQELLCVSNTGPHWLDEADGVEGTHGVQVVRQEAQFLLRKQTPTYLKDQRFGSFFSKKSLNLGQVFGKARSRSRSKARFGIRSFKNILLHTYISRVFDPGYFVKTAQFRIRFANISANPDQVFGKVCSRSAF